MVTVIKGPGVVQPQDGLLDFAPPVNGSVKAQKWPCIRGRESLNFASLLCSDLCRMASKDSWHFFGLRCFPEATFCHLQHSDTPNRLHRNATITF